MADLKLCNLEKIYPWDSPAEKKKALENSDNPMNTEKGVIAVQNFNLDIADKEFIVLVGPSGCGKSTVLRMIAGLEEPTEGEIYIGEKCVNDVTPKDRDIAMVFQNYALYPHMTVYDNMAFSLKMRHTPKDIIDKKVREAAEILGITEYLDRKPKALSGGQRQRVAIGRAIVREPQVFLMDEPLSNLDAKLRNQMRAEIIKLRRRVDTTFIYVTHDQTEAMTLGDRIVILKDGVVMQSGTPQEVFDRPANLFVAGFIGTPQMNFFDGRLVKQENNGYAVLLAGKLFALPEEIGARLSERNIPDRDVKAGIRPEHLLLSKDGVPAAVDVSEMMGSTTHVHVKMGGIDAVAILPGGSDLGTFEPGQQLSFTCEGSHIHLFDAATGANLVW